MSLADDSTEFRVVDDDAATPKLEVAGPTEVAVVTALAAAVGTVTPATKRPKVATTAATFDRGVLNLDLCDILVAFPN